MHQPNGAALVAAQDAELGAFAVTKKRFGRHDAERRQCQLQLTI